MKSKEEIKLMGEKYAITHEDVSDRLGKYLVSACFQDGYIQCQCQEDMAEKKYTEEDLLHAFREGVLLPNSQIGIMEDIFKQVVESLNKQD